MPRTSTPVVLFAASTVITAALLVGRADLAAGPGPRVPDYHADDFDAWAGRLERGGVVEVVRRPCATERAEHLAEHGTPAPEFLLIDRVETFGPLPQELAADLARRFDEIAEVTLRDAERMEVGDLAAAEAQMQELLQGLKARATARAFRDGRYWTVAENERPRLPPQFSYWQVRPGHSTDGGVRVDAFVPIDLRAPELAAAHEALRSFAAERRRERCAEFNRMGFDERRGLVEDAARVARGESTGRAVPDWYWDLRVDRVTMLATPIDDRRH